MCLLCTHICACVRARVFISRWPRIGFSLLTIYLAFFVCARAGVCVEGWLIYYAPFLIEHYVLSCPVRESGFIYTWRTTGFSLVTTYLAFISHKPPSNLFCHCCLQTRGPYIAFQGSNIFGSLSQNLLIHPIFLKAQLSQPLFHLEVYFQNVLLKYRGCKKIQTIHFFYVLFL